MKAYLKILPFYLCIGLSILAACKRNDPAPERSADNKPAVPTLPEKKLVPTQIGTGKSKMSFSYTTNHSLSKIEYGDGTSTVLEFTPGGIPYALVHYDGEEMIAYTEYRLDNANRVIKAANYATTGNVYKKVGSYTFSYSSDLLIAGILYYNGQEILTNTEERFYEKKGNLIREQNSNAAFTADYLYDDKNGLFKNAGYAWLFVIEEPGKLFLSSLNNISSCTYPSKPANNQTFVYTYNQDQYPETISSVIAGVKLSQKVTYKAVE